jgi:TPR repeat protein
VKNFKKAVEYYSQAAEQDNALAQYNLGCLYRDGIGVIQNNKQALKWLARAAEQGNEDAQADLYSLIEAL